MLGYLLFLVPMSIAFVWISRSHGVKQALLDLLAFNLMFIFDFAALLPNNTTLLLVHLLLLALIGTMFLRAVHTRHWWITRRAGLSLLVAFVFLSWMVIASYLNKTQWWTVARITTDAIYTYVLPTLFIIVGIQLSKDNGLIRFAKILFFACSLVGVIAIAQTVSNGELFSNYISDYYLGVFQPLGAKTLERRETFVTGINYLVASKTIRFAGISFYRGEGSFEGAYITLCTVATAIFSLLLSRNKAISTWLFVPFFFSVAGIVTAFNRTAILTFVAVGVYTLFARFGSLLSSRVMSRWIVPIIAVLLVVGISFEPVSKVIGANLDGFLGTRNDQVVSLNGRVGLWEHVFSQIAENPVIGTGEPNTALRVGWDTDDNPENDLGAHNSFLQFALRGGLMPGMIYLFLFLFCLFRLARLSHARVIPQQQRVVFFALFVAIMAFAVLNLTGSWMIITPIASLFWILCGYVVAYKSKSDRGRSLPG